MAYWYNVRTRQVETDDDRARDEDVMGPYDTHEAASSALSSARQRTEAWDEEDERRAREDGDEPDTPNALGL
ncbi:hypothetical protein [Arsenicicoccus sp. oral taxon 190]|uniref:hypothetical protein n=1 Tax=Arsenicicoccus sp. oral taxon 190 TaxID=1658671 RepID=UPI000679FE33|nr:hypothetical protein [Arsenicicoccus sp. oral taxon 190]AKT52114.1 hypothetical protein ADJ73_14005 [Arsenicicoccus sp. oral taxon 190]